MSHCLINGQALNQIDAQHRGLAFGDGIFETCFSQSGRVRFLDDHLLRLQRGIDALQLRWEPSETGQLLGEIQSLLGMDAAPAVIKIMLLRQSEGRGYDYDPDRQLTDRIVMRTAYQPPDWVNSGARLVISERYASINPDLAGIKHLNRLDSVLARQDARRQQAHEALLCLPDGRLVEGSMSNIYLRLAGQWTTPELSGAGVDGIIRRRLLSNASLDLACKAIDKSEAMQAEAAIISNALLGLVPVVELNGRRLLMPEPSELKVFRQMAGLNHG